MATQSTLSIGSKAVAVKIMTKQQAVFTSRNYETELLCARQEAELIVRACNKGGTVLSDLTTKVLGFTEGPVPEGLTAMFNLARGEQAFGIVMRLEEGGSLDKLLYRTDCTTPLSFLERIRLLMQLCRGVAELHDKDVTHGDLKLENVLLHSLNQPDIRIADFGLSQLREDGDNAIGQSATRMTTHFKGTPKYSAPEMLVYKDGGLAKASKSSDVYALAIMAHEILSGLRPFDDITNVGRLTMEVGNGTRPSLDKLPSEVSTPLREMMAACWDGDKRKRYSAMQCYALVN